MVYARDTNTKEILESKGIKSYFSGCLTLTLGMKYKDNMKDGHVYFVDPYYELGCGNRYFHGYNIIYAAYLTVKHYSKIRHFKNKFSYEFHTRVSRISTTLDQLFHLASFYETYSKMFSDEILFSANYVTHNVRQADFHYDNDEKMEYARELIRKYAKAKLVVTSRIHCALPCLGVETPVIFVNSDNLNGGKLRSGGRFGGLIDLLNVAKWSPKGVKIVTESLRSSLIDGKIDLGSKVVNSEEYIKLRDSLIVKTKDFVLTNLKRGGVDERPYSLEMKNCASAPKNKERMKCISAKEELRKVKIAFVGLYNEKNYGDPIIFDTTEWLYKKNLSTSQFQSCRLYLDYVEKTYRKSLKKRIINKVYRLLCLKCPQSPSSEELLEKTKEYFDKSIGEYDLVVVVGGGIVKWTYQFFHVGLTALLQMAEKHNVPVVFNAVGVEGYSESDKKCQMLKQSMQLPALIHVSTRDDLSTLFDKYYDGKPNRPVLQVADPAVWVSEAYGIKKKDDSHIIGVGIARGKIFNDNRIDVSPEFMADLYVQIVSSLRGKGYVVEIFTNGMLSDNKFADIVFRQLLQKGIEVRKRFPSSPRDLVKMISSYKAIIATRLHSCIIAYSLDVPAIGLVWNDKLSFFGRNIHAEENFIRCENFNADYIVQKAEQAMANGYDANIRKAFRQTIIDDIMNIDKRVTSIPKCKHLLNGGGKYDLFVYP